MNPTQDISYALRFAVPLSPWWLLLILPAAAAAVYLLYRAQMKVVARKHGLALLALRMLLVLVIVFILFRPSLVRRKVLTYDGRVAVVYDDSRSSETRDNAVSGPEALALARQLNGGGIAGNETFYQMARSMRQVEAKMRDFQRFSQTADRQSDAFWTRAEKARSALNEVFQQATERARLAPAIGEQADRDFRLALAEVKGLQDGLATFFSGSQEPSPKAFDRYCNVAEAAGESLLSLQARYDALALAEGDAGAEATTAPADANTPAPPADANALAAGDGNTPTTAPAGVDVTPAQRAALREAVANIRRATRLELLSEKLRQVKGRLPEMLPEKQFFQFVSLMTGADTQREAFDPNGIEPVDGPTDIVGRLERIAQSLEDADNPASRFPLSAVVLLSDGQDHSGRSPQAVEQMLARKQVPVYTGGMGFATEPHDVAILAINAPPFAEAGTAVRIGVRLKTALPRPVETTLEIRKGAEVVATERIEIGADRTAEVEVSFTPETTGVFRYQLSVARVGGEAFPTRNNKADFAMHVREGKAKVLLLDYEPRWETRFALNVLRRLRYIDVNPIVVVTQPGAELKRGVQRGTWPQDRPTLDIYDLVLIGDLPEGTLTAAEWQALAGYVADGGSVCFLAGPDSVPVPAEGDLRQTLLPVSDSAWPGADANNPLARLETPDDLRLTAAGLYHPVTLPTAAVIQPRQLEQAPPGLRADTQPLMVTATGNLPVISSRFSGAGRSLLIQTDRLWKVLNPTALRAHTQMYVSLVTWAIQSGWADPASGEAPALALDRLSGFSADGLEVWARGLADGSVVASDANGQEVARAPLTPAYPGAELMRAEFPQLPARNLTFSAGQGGAQAQAGPVLLVADRAELKFLARNDALLSELARTTGGRTAGFAELERFFLQMRTRQEVRPEESVWRLWDAAAILVLLAVLLTVEWVYRKLVGLV